MPVKLLESRNGSKRYERHWKITPKPSNMHHSIHRRFERSLRNARHFRLVKIDVCLARLSSIRIRLSFCFSNRRRSLVPTEHWIESNFHPFNGSQKPCSSCESKMNVHQFVFDSPHSRVYYVVSKCDDSFRDFRCVFFHSFLISMNVHDA